MEVSDTAGTDHKEIAVADIPTVAPVVEPAATMPATTTLSRPSSQTLQQVRSNPASSIAAMVAVKIFE